jgi:hypothetical protein
MSTRAYVGIERLDGSVRYIYCHFDGTLERLGNCLQDNYNTTAIVNDLIDNGDASQIKSTVSDSVFYHRDKGEDFAEVQASFEDNRANYSLDLEGNMAYLFSESMGSWTVLYGCNTWVGIRRACSLVVA